MAKTNFIGHNRITIRANFSTADSINMTLIINTICKKMYEEFKTNDYIKPKAYIYNNANTIVLYNGDTLPANMFINMIIGILENLTEIELYSGYNNTKKRKYWAEYIVECGNGENYFIAPDKYKEDDNNG